MLWTFRTLSKIERCVCLIPSDIEHPAHFSLRFIICNRRQGEMNVAFTLHLLEHAWKRVFCNTDSRYISHSDVVNAWIRCCPCCYFTVMLWTGWVLLPNTCWSMNEIVQCGAALCWVVCAECWIWGRRSHCSHSLPWTLMGYRRSVLMCLCLFLSKLDNGSEMKTNHPFKFHENQTSSLEAIYSF